MVLRVRTFGECVMEIGGRRITPDAEIVFAMLLLLVFECGERVPREKMRRYLWPSLPESADRQRFRQALYKVRRMAHIPVEVTATHVSLKRDAVDADFLRLLEPGWADVFIAAEAPNGEFLPGYCPTFSAPFAEWLEAQRDVVHTRVRLALCAAIVSCRERGDWKGVEQLARACLRVDPLNHDATVALAEAAAATGRRMDAIAVLDSFLAEARATTAIAPSRGAAVLRERISERLDFETYSDSSERGAEFVGRGESIQLLRDCSRSTRAGRATAVFVWGEPGIGKTRLMDEFRTGAILDGSHVRRVTCQSGDLHRPLAIFADLTPQLRTLPGALGCSPESVPYLDLLGAGIDGPFGQAKNAEVSEAIAQGLRASLFDLLDAATSESRVIVIVEDVHLADQASKDLLREMILWVDSRPLLFVMTSRTAPTFRVAGGEELAGRLIVHRLPALSTEATTELLRSIATARRRELESEFVDWAARVAEGNPFYLGELLHRWLQTNELYSVPPTLGTLLHGRIAGLEKRELRLLQACAAMRRQSRPDRLQSLLGYSNLDMIESMEVLGAAGLLVVLGDRTECRHELIAEAALAHLTESVRQTLFRMAAELLEREASESTGMALLWDCAQLWRDAGDVDRAVKTGVHCAERLIQMGSPQDAADLVERILELCDADEQRLLLYHVGVEALSASTQYARLIKYIACKRRLRDQEELITDDHDRDELLALDARWRLTADAAGGLESVEKCIQAPTAPPAHRITAAVLGMILADGNCDEMSACRIYERVRDQLDSHGYNEMDGQFVDLIYHTSFGSLDRAEQLADMLVAQCMLDFPHAAAFKGLRYSGFTYRRAGRHDKAISTMSTALRVAETCRLRNSMVSAVEGIVQCYLDVDDHVSARKWLDHAMRRLTQAEDAGVRCSLLFVEGEITLAEGEVPPLRLIYDDAFASFASCRTARVRINALAMQVGIHVKNHNVVSELLLDELLTLHLLHRARGGQDFVAHMLFLGLRACGREAEGRLLMTEYLTRHRRDRGQPPRRIAALAIPRSGLAGTSVAE